MNYYSDSKVWKQCFREIINWDQIIPLYYPNFPTAEGFKNKEELLDFYDDLLNQVGDWTANKIAPRARILDEHGAGKVENFSTVPSPALQEFYKEAKELQAFGISCDPKYGGLGIPVAVSMIGLTFMGRACLSSFTQIGFFSSIADMIERFCSEETRNKFIPKIINGEISGSMCLTEPGAGSDVGSLRTSAEKQADGTYLLNGSKMFITNGGGGLAFILARVKGAPKGLEGISLFFAEEWLENSQGEKIKNYKIVKNEEKMGLHGSFTCEVLYENTKAILVGEEHKGLSIMFHLMNEARIAVGLQCLGGIEATLSYAKKYAAEREQFGKKLLDLPLYRKNMQEWDTELDAIRVLMVDTISHFDVYQKLDMKLRHTGELNQSEKEQMKKAQKIIRRRTPLVKYYGSESYTMLSTKGIQALGGYGFIKDYDAERYHRDSFAPLLYEGTSQIQALMALKDLIKFIIKKPATFFLSTVGNNPIVSLANEQDSLGRMFSKVHYEFKKNLIALLIKCLRPSQIDKIFKMESWQDEKSIEHLMGYAESITQALSYIETLRIISKNAPKNEYMKDLFMRYHKLTAPRFAAIYTEWKY